MGRWKYEFDAIDPSNLSSRWRVGIAEEHYRRICNSGHEKAQARIVLVKEALEAPVALYKGWSRLGKDDDCYAYVAKPKDDYHKLAPTICVPAPPGMVFVVFVLDSGTIDEWTWRPHVNGDISKPVGLDGERIWLPNQN